MGTLLLTLIVIIFTQGGSVIQVQRIISEIQYMCIVCFSSMVKLSVLITEVSTFYGILTRGGSAIEVQRLLFDDMVLLVIVT